VKEETMGALRTVIGFGAGYILGANRNAEPIQRAKTRLRDLVRQRLPGTTGTITDVRLISEVMTPTPEMLDPDTTLVEAARHMADGDFGDVLVRDPGTEKLIGMVTDRDITVRAVAAERDPSTTTVRSILSGDLETVGPLDTLQEATARMRAANVRRLPVLEDGRVVGIVSLGDLSLETDTGGTLADISLATPDR
jgi:CBS domain-containing protein